MTKKNRAPEAFEVMESKKSTPEASRDVTQKPSRQALAIDLENENLIITDNSDDIFRNDDLDVPISDGTPSKTQNKGTSSFPFMKIMLAALGLMISLSIGLWIDGLIRELFSRNDWLGWLAIAASSIFFLALLGFILREMIAIGKLRSVEKLRADIHIATNERQFSKTQSRKLVERVTKIISHQPETAKGRAALEQTEGDIIDAPDLIALAETELMKNLDDSAKVLIMGAAKRVSVVTALSPRALIDAGFVIFEMTRLARNIAELYGARPGFWGTFRLLKSIAAHLAVTGSVAIGENIFQQFISHGVASKISARFGEGLVNGIMTTRFGIVAMDVSRPMPFKELPRPKISDFVSELGSMNTKK